MKSWVVHYKNKYPGSKVILTDSSLDVYDVKGDHVVSMRVNGAGQWTCVSDEMGCKDAHDLAPIPKDARVHKVVEGKISLDEHHEERSKKSQDFCQDGKVLSCKELEKEGYQFDDKHRVVAAPKA